MRGGEDAGGHNGGVHDQEVVPDPVHVCGVGGAVAGAAAAVHGGGPLGGEAVHERAEGGAGRGDDPGHDVLDAVLHGQAVPGGAEDPGADPAQDLGAPGAGRGARGARTDVPQGAVACAAPVQARPHRHAAARGRQDRGPQLPHRAQALRGGLAGTRTGGAHRDGAVRGGVVRDDGPLLQGVPRAGQQEARCARHHEPRQVPRLRVPHQAPRGARGQDHRLLRLRVRPQDLRPPPRQALHLRAHLTARAHAHPRPVPEQPRHLHHLPLQGRGHVHRPSRGHRPHPDLLPLRVPQAGGAEARQDPARAQEERSRVQGLLLQSRVHGH